MTVLVEPETRENPSTDKVKPALKRRSEGGAGADDDEDEDVPVVGAGAGGGLCCASGLAGG